MQSGKFSILSLVLVFIVFLVVAAALFPMLARTTEPCGEANCQNNLKQCA